METKVTMKRHVTAGLVCLSLAGCAHTQQSVAKRDGEPPHPVAITPVPSVHDTINRGLGGNRLAATTMQDPSDPRWNGRAPAPGAAPEAASVAAAPGPQASPSTPVMASPSSAVAEAAPAAAGPAISAASATASRGTSIATPGYPMPNYNRNAAAMNPAAATASSSPAAGPAVDPGDLPLATSLPATGAGAAALPANPAGLNTSTPFSAATFDKEVTVSSAPAEKPAPAATPAQAPAAKPAATRDPLLGSDPDVMPPLPPLPGGSNAGNPAPQATESRAPASASAPASAPAAVSVPPSLPDLAPATGAAPASGTAAPIEAAPALEPSAPAPGGSAALTPNPTAKLATLTLEPASDLVSEQKMLKPSRPKSDGRVVLASLNEDDLVAQPAKPASSSKKHRAAGRPVARVGDEVITFHDLVVATQERVRKLDKMQPPNNLTPEQQAMRHREIEMLAHQTLKDLVDQMMIAQEFKRKIKDAKMIDRLNGEADNVWRAEELPLLYREYKVDNEVALREKMNEQNRSLDALQRSFRQLFMAQTYLHHELKDRVKVELPDLLAYYNEHLGSREFDRPASVTWREVIIERKNYRNEQEARARADAILARLKKGEDLANVARQDSEGPMASRRLGGLMVTAPGSYRVQSVNQALESLPLGKLSDVIEGEDGYHIIRVERRRAAGPATFEEVQDEIKPILTRRKQEAETVAFLTRLRERTTIRTIFDANPGDL